MFISLTLCAGAFVGHMFSSQPHYCHSSVRPAICPLVRPSRLHYWMCIKALVLFTRLFMCTFLLSTWELLGAAACFFFSSSSDSTVQLYGSVEPFRFDSFPNRRGRCFQTHTNTFTKHLLFFRSSPSSAKTLRYLLSVGVRFFSSFFRWLALYSQNPRIIYLW